MRHEEVLCVNVHQLWCDFDVHVAYDVYANGPQDRAEGLGANHLDESSVEILDVQELWLQFVEDARPEVPVTGSGLSAIVECDGKRVDFKRFEGYLYSAAIETLCNRSDV